MLFPRDGNHKWHIIESAKVADPTTLGPRFLTELKLFIERLRNGDILWDVDRVTNATLPVHITSVHETIRKEETANIYIGTQ